MAPQPTPLDHLKFPVRLDGLIVKQDTLYVMRNHFTDAWEIVADTQQTVDKARESGLLEKARQKVARFTNEDSR